MAIMDGRKDAKDRLQDIFNCAKRNGHVPEDAVFDPRETDDEAGSTRFRLVAVDPNGVPYPGLEVDGVQLITDSTRLAPLGARL